MQLGNSNGTIMDTIGAINRIFAFFPKEAVEVTSTYKNNPQDKKRAAELLAFVESNFGGIGFSVPDDIEPSETAYVAELYGLGSLATSAT